jgi:hypothetical protein
MDLVDGMDPFDRLRAGSTDGTDRMDAVGFANPGRVWGGDSEITTQRGASGLTADSCQLRALPPVPFALFGAS